MTLEWLAHSCFCLANEEGHRLLIDPYRGEDTGYKEPQLDKVDVVICSHGHMDHANTAVIQNPDYMKIDKAGHFETKGFAIDTVPTYHDDENGTKRGEKPCFHRRDRRLALLSLRRFGPCAGQRTGKGTGKDRRIDDSGRQACLPQTPNRAAEVVEALDVKIVIPMHYKTEACRYDLAPVEDFLEEMKKSEYAISMYHDSVMHLDGYTIPKRAKVYVMESKY